MKYNIHVKRCKKCIMPEVPGHIVIDEDGICQFCKQYSKTQTDVAQTFQDFDAEKKLSILKKKVSKYKNKGSYDCVVSVSGGKDSIATLYIAVKVLGLKPLAIFVDNGFALDEMYDNVKNATDILGVDLLIYKTSDMLKLFHKLIKSGKNCTTAEFVMLFWIMPFCQTVTNTASGSYLVDIPKVSSISRIRNSCGFMRNPTVIS